jgi:hypothetical protein
VNAPPQPGEGRVAYPLVFPSRHHPGAAPLAVVYARELTGPLAGAMIALMVAATAAVLMSQDPAPTLAWAAPLAALLAAAFAGHHARRLPAELVLYADRAALRSVWDVASGRTSLPLRVLPPRRVREGLNVGIGPDVVTLTPEDWPDYPRLREALTRSAFHAEAREPAPDLEGEPDVV